MRRLSYCRRLLLYGPLTISGMFIDYAAFLQPPLVLALGQQFSHLPHLPSAHWHVPHLQSSHLHESPQEHALQAQSVHWQSVQQHPVCEAFCVQPPVIAVVFTESLCIAGMPENANNSPVAAIKPTREIILIFIVTAFHFI